MTTLAQRSLTRHGANHPVLTGRYGLGTCRAFLVGPATYWRSWTVQSTGRRNTCLLQSADDVLRGFTESPKDSVWVSKGTSYLAALAKQSVQPSGNRRLLVLNPIEEVTHHVLSTWFRFVVVRKGSISLLPPKELLEVLQAKNRDELFIGGAYDSRGRVIVLYRGSVEPIVVPLDWFKEQDGQLRANPRKLSVIDYGQTVKLGDYEAGADAILYEFDEEYRRRAKKRFIDSDPSLGGAIRRLRLQRGLSQRDFAPVPVRTIARIERGEVSKPHSATLKRIADRLSVAVDALASY